MKRTLCIKSQYCLAFDFGRVKKGGAEYPGLVTISPM